MKNIGTLIDYIYAETEVNKQLRYSINDLKEILESQEKLGYEAKCSYLVDLRHIIVEHNQLLAKAAVQLDLLLKLYEKLEEKEGE